MKHTLTGRSLNGGRQDYENIETYSSFEYYGRPFRGFELPTLRRKWQSALENRLFARTGTTRFLLYNCAPDGYYGPEWFSGGIFIGAGPWFHGPGGFYGHVDHHFDYRKGYHGPMPARGERPAEHRAEFHGQAMHDARGREAPRGHR